MSEQVVLKSNVKDTGLEAVRESIAAKGAGSPYTQDLNHKQEETGGRGGIVPVVPGKRKGKWEPEGRPTPQRKERVRELRQV